VFEFAMKMVYQNATSVNDINIIINTLDNLQTFSPVVPNNITFPISFKIKVVVTRVSDKWVRSYQIIGGNVISDSRMNEAFFTSTSFTSSFTPSFGIQMDASPATTSGDYVNFAYMSMVKIS
jgi:hypothetical protein